MPHLTSIGHRLTDAHRQEPQEPPVHDGESDDLALMAVPGLISGNEPLRRSNSDDPLGGTGVPDAVSAELSRRRGGGDALPTELAGPMGEHLGTDLSTVRVHTDSGSGALARSIEAAAFTHGNDIYFAPGAYRPGSPDGQRMLAHELSHVAAQRSGADSGSGAAGLTVGHANDPAEAAADRSADSVMAALRRTSADTTAERHFHAGESATDQDGPLDLSALRRWRWPWEKSKDKSKGSGTKPENSTKEEVKGTTVTPTKDETTSKSVSFGETTVIPNEFPKIATIGSEQVRVTCRDDEDEANRIATELKDTYGIDLSSATTVKAIKKDYRRVPKKVTNKLAVAVWSIEELRALSEAASYYAPILGSKRDETSLKGSVQGVTTIGKVNNAIDKDSKKGSLDTSTLGEYFGSSKNLGLTNAGSDYKDRNFVRPGKSETDVSTSLTATAIHEMAHGLIEPTYLSSWVRNLPYWADEDTASGTKGAEIPPTSYGKESAAEDLCESVAMFFINREDLKSKCPRREKLIDLIIASWKPEQKKQLVTVAVSSPGTESPPPTPSDGSK